MGRCDNPIYSRTQRKLSEGNQTYTPFQSSAGPDVLKVELAVQPFWRSAFSSSRHLSRSSPCQNWPALFPMRSRVRNDREEEQGRHNRDDSRHGPEASEAVPSLLWKVYWRAAIGGV